MTEHSAMRTGRIDQNALRFNQAAIVVLTVLAFVIGADVGAWIVLFVGLGLAVGAALPGYGFFQLVYRHLLVPSGVVKPALEPGSPTPHRFAQAMGGVCLIASALFLFASWNVAGWALAWIVIALAAVNLIFGFCAGCFIYLHLDRLRQNGMAVR